MSRSAVNMLIKRNTTTTTNIEAIAGFFRVPVGYFFDDEKSDTRLQTNILSPNCINGDQSASDLLQVIAEKDAIIRQKDELIEKMVNTIIDRKLETGK